MMAMSKICPGIFMTLILPILSLARHYNTVCFETRTGNNGTRYCFSDAPPFDDLPLPKDPFKEIAPVYYQFRQSPGNFRIIASCNELNLTNGLVVITHGWTGDFNTTAKWHQPIIKNLFKIMPNVEILFVEWKKGAALSHSKDPYDQPASNTRSIAAAITDFLLENEKFNATNAHCIGFSLGSHVCGFIGKRLKAGGAKMGWGRLTALDPASLSFDTDNPSARVDKGDAEFVDVIHTSRLGLRRQIGDIDFFVSGTKTQPGCQHRSRRANIFMSIINWAVESYRCSHERAPQIFAETIMAQLNFNLTGVVSDVDRTGPGSCTFSKFCPCPSLDEYNRGRCRTCRPEVAQVIGYWSFVRQNRGSFYGDLTEKAPYCVEA